jgi:D-alanyl-D-alanine carboxypeptidase
MTVRPVTVLKVDPMSRDLNDLDPQFLPKAKAFLDRVAAEGIAVTIVSTRRTPEEQADAIRRGTSKIKKSRHLEGRAIDIVPTHLMQEKLWAPRDPIWERLARIGELSGLKAGFRWRIRDCGHFEDV